MSDRYALIGNPVAHSKSPWIHAEFARATAQDLDYGLIEAPLDGFRRDGGAFSRGRRQGPQRHAAVQAGGIRAVQRA